MAKVEPNDLIITLKENKMDDYRIQEQKKLLSSISEKDILEKYQSILLSTSESEDKILNKGIYFALLGALYGFHDRELNPLDPNHSHLFTIIKDDIKNVYSEISESLINEDIWVFESFDYGIKHVYYLDWQLYLSKICY